MTPLSDLFTNTILPGGPLPSPPPSELNNLNVGLHTHVIINKLCPRPFHPQQNKNKVKSAWLPTATSGSTNVSNLKKDNKSLKQCCELLFLRVNRVTKSLSILDVGQVS